MAGQLDPIGLRPVHQLADQLVIQSPATCGRSARSYASKVADRFGLASTDVTCRGATTANILTTGQHGKPPQISALTADTRLVTVTVGGNDVDYLGSLSVYSCQNTHRPHCGTVDQRAIDAALSTVHTKIGYVVAAVHRHAPKAQVLLVEYLTVLPASDGCSGVPLTTAQAGFERKVAARLLSATQQAAADQQATVVDAAGASANHNACVHPMGGEVRRPLRLHALPPETAGHGGRGRPDLRPTGLSSRRYEHAGIHAERGHRPLRVGRRRTGSRFAVCCTGVGTCLVEQPAAPRAARSASSPPAPPHVATPWSATPLPVPRTFAFREPVQGPLRGDHVLLDERREMRGGAALGQRTLLLGHNYRWGKVRRPPLSMVRCRGERAGPADGLHRPGGEGSYAVVLITDEGCRFGVGGLSVEFDTFSKDRPGTHSAIRPP
ncbi:SGNH/GDSL hydrolase family protein [Streptomyces sp. NPDC052811]|uniref:SGNH/GDSL hydrolase family protein n=1 Tax=Streptomyces sp. NPDC052811 TaxID=3155731 RepID=UPI0034444177